MDDDVEWPEVETESDAGIDPVVVQQRTHRLTGRLQASTTAALHRGRGVFRNGSTGTVAGGSTIRCGN